MFYILVPPLVLLKKNLIIKIKHEYILLINDGNNTWNTLNFSSSLLSTFFILLKNNYFLELVGISGSFFFLLTEIHTCTCTHLYLGAFHSIASDWMLCPPHICMLKPNPKCGGIWRCGFSEMIRSWGWNPHKWG